MKKITVTLLLTFALLALSGCGGVAESIVDPAGYTQRSMAQSEAQRAQAEAQQAFAHSQEALANSEAERSRSEAQRAQAEAQASAAQAEAQARQVEAQAAFATEATEAVRKAAGQNGTAVIFGMILIALIAGWSVWNMQRVTVAASMAAQPPAQGLLSVPPQVQMIAEARGYTVSVAHDGRWLLIDDQGVVKLRQKQLTG